MKEQENGGTLRGEEADAGEAQAWAEVARAWDDEERHLAYLARFRDLEGLAVAGGRYREVLEARPQDAVALRWRDEVVKRATAAGLASVPRELPAFGRVPRWVRSLAIAVGAAFVVGLLLALVRSALNFFVLGRGP